MVFFFPFYSNASMLVSVRGLFAFSGEVVLFSFTFIRSVCEEGTSGCNENYISGALSLNP